MKKQPLRVIALASTKGGVGKTTLASALAVRATMDGSRVALIDMDPQLSLARWHELRGFPSNPKRIELEAASREAIGLLAAQRWNWVFIDSPPAMLDVVENAISMADYVLVPCKTSALDVEAIRDVVLICKEHNKPFAFVLNQVLSPPGRLAEGARRYLEDDGSSVFTAMVTNRKPFMAAMTLGKTGPELRDGQEAAREIEAVWAELKAAVRKL